MGLVIVVCAAYELRSHPSRQKQCEARAYEPQESFIIIAQLASHSICRHATLTLHPEGKTLLAPNPHMVYFPTCVQSILPEGHPNHASAHTCMHSTKIPVRRVQHLPFVRLSDTIDAEARRA